MIQSTIVVLEKVPSSSVNSLEKKPENPRLVAQWQVVNGRLECRWGVD